MLKVVGASWYKTRISTYILMGSGLLCIAAFFVAEMERPKFDGTYCATVYWSKNSGFKIEYWKQRTDLENIPKGVARTCYKDLSQENGWSQIEIETHRTYPDWVQAFGAGLLEGSLTWNSIYEQWTNTISSACDQDENSQNFCTWLRDLLSSNYRKIKEQLKQKHLHHSLFKHDHYWHQIQLYYYQLEGLEHGWRNGAKRARSDLEEEIPSEDFLLLNSLADIKDLKVYFQNYVMHENKQKQNYHEQRGELENIFSIPSATMLMKLSYGNCSNNNENYDEKCNQTGNSHNNTNNNENNLKLLFGHISSDGSHLSKFRMQKRYKFHYHFTSDQKTNTIPGVDITFTSYPGILSSLDDFYIIRGRQVHSLVAGVTLKNDQQLQLWESIDLNSIIPLSARVMASNRISQNRRSWNKLMSRHPLTGSKKWFVIDLKKLDNLNIQPSSSLPQYNNNQRQTHHNKHLNDEEQYNFALSTITSSNNLKNDTTVVVEVPSSTTSNIDNISHTKNLITKGVIFIVEQIPGRLHAEDITENFIHNKENSYIWFSNGASHFKDANSKEFDDENSVFTSGINITNLDDIEFLLRRNSVLPDNDVESGGKLIQEQQSIKLFSYQVKFGSSGSTAISEYHANAGPLLIETYQYNKRELKIPIDSIINSEEDSMTATMTSPSLTAKILENINYKTASRVDKEINTKKEESNRHHRHLGLSSDDYSKNNKHLGYLDDWKSNKITPKWAWYD